MDPKQPLAVQLRSQLRALLRTKHQLHIEPAERPAASQLLSHIGGDPYFEQGEAWPTNPDTGQPLELIFQLVNDDGRCMQTAMLRKRRATNLTGLSLKLSTFVRHGYHE